MSGDGAPPPVRVERGLAAVAGRLVRGGELQRYRPLEGGVSAILHAIEVRTPDGRVAPFVVRRHRSLDWKPQDAKVTRIEFELLRALHRLGMAVPEPRLLDESGETLPSPFYVMDFVPGSTAVAEAERSSAIRQMADFLARLHATDVGENLPPLPEREEPEKALAAYLPADELGARLQQALSDGRFRVPKPPRARALLHGDYWPGNVLWLGGQIAAVVDWEDAAFGDPLSDLACARVEMLCHYDEEAMEAFTTHYCDRTSLDLSGLPLWEVYVSASALASMGHWGLPAEVETERRRRTRHFLERAARELLALVDSRPHSATRST